MFLFENMLLFGNNMFLFGNNIILFGNNMFLFGNNIVMFGNNMIPSREGGRSWGERFREGKPFSEGREGRQIT